MANEVEPAARAAQRGNALLLVVSWVWVGVPLAWGVFETLQRSLGLFR
jgi:hypothetical protein